MCLESDSKGVHDVMLYLVQEYGDSILFQPRLEGLLADLLGGEYALYPVVKRAVATHLAQRLVEGTRQSENAVIVIDTLKQSFGEENFLNPQVASYLVDSYAYALGLVDCVDESYMEEQDHSGEPEFVACDDGDFCGYTNADNERCGFGILREANGNYYAGEWNLGMRMGFGMGFGSLREKYAGQWRINKKSGVGVEIQQDGSLYSGQWKNGKKEGLGTIYFANGKCLTGFFHAGELQKEGAMWFLEDRTVVQGNITMNGPTGLCFHTLRDGSIVEEYWNNGVLVNNEK